ncbi:unnamed protein product [Alopecurus aequalis]
MALCVGGSSNRVAVVLLLLALLLPLLLTSPPRVEARPALLAGARSSVENGDKKEAVGWTLIPAPPAFGGAGMRPTSGVGNAVAVVARVLGSVPSPGVGH